MAQIVEDEIGGFAPTVASLHLRDRQSVPILLIFAAILWGTLARGAFYQSDLIGFMGLSLLAGGSALLQARSTRPGRWWLLVAAAPVAAIAASAIAHKDIGDVPPAVAPILAAVSLGIAGAGVSHGATRWLVLRLVADVAAFLALLCWAGVALHLRAFAQPLNQGWRAAATIGYANVTGLFLLLGLLCAAGLAARTGRLSDEIRCWLLVVGLLATQSRSVALALAICVAISWWCSRRLAAVLVRTGIWALLAFAGLLPSIHDATPNVTIAVAALGASIVLLIWTRQPARSWVVRRALPTGVFVAAAAGGFVALHARVFDLRSDAGRLRLWSDAAVELRTASWFGQGPRQPAALSRGTLVTLLLHDDPLQFAQYYGYAGIAALLLVAGAIGWKLAKARTAAYPELWATALCVVVATTVVALVDFPLQVPLIPTVVTLVIGTCISPGRSRGLARTEETGVELDDAGIGVHQTELNRE